MQTDRFSRRSVLRTAGSLRMILEPAFAFQTAGPVRHEEARASISEKPKYAIRFALHGLRAQKNAKAL